MLPAIPDCTNFIKNSFASSACTTGNISAKTTMSMEQWWNYTDRGKKPKYSEKTLAHFHLVHHKSHMDWPGMELWPPRWEAGE